MIVVFSPARGYFAGCETAGFGGSEGSPTWVQDLEESLNLERPFQTIPSIADQHLSYIHRETPDAMALHGTEREIRGLVAAIAVHGS